MPSFAVPSVKTAITFTRAVHCLVTCQIPLGLRSLLLNIQLLKREEQRQIVLGRHGFLPNKMIHILGGVDEESVSKGKFPLGEI